MSALTDYIDDAVSRHGDLDAAAERVSVEVTNEINSRRQEAKIAKLQAQLENA